MAEEEQSTQQQGQGQGQNQQNAQKSSSRLVTVIIGLAVLVLVLTPTVTIIALKTMVGPGAEESKSEQDANPKGTKVVMPKIQTNIAGTKGRRYVQFEILLKVSNSKTAKLFRRGPDEDGESLQKQAQARIVTISSQKDLDTLLNQAGKDEMRKEIKRSLNELLTQEEKDGVVTKVLLTNFLVQ